MNTTRYGTSTGRAFWGLKFRAAIVMANPGWRADRVSDLREKGADQNTDTYRKKDCHPDHSGHCKLTDLDLETKRLGEQVKGDRHGEEREQREAQVKAGHIGETPSLLGNLHEHHRGRR